MSKMGEALKPMFHGSSMMAFVEEDDIELSGSVSFSGDSRSSSIVSLSSDVTDDATSSPRGSPPPTLPSQLDACGPGPLYELSSLMPQLPIKRGLSNFFSGKSQSFTSLSDVRCVEDLAKKETPYKRKIKLCKSYGGMFDPKNRSYFTPGAYSKTITKKSPRGSCASLAAKRSNGGLFGSSKPPPPVPVQKNT